MCLLFFNVNDGCSNDEFRLVLVNNRDEFWSRPTSPATFWSSSCISGLDLVPSRAGGTWFGANSQGRIGCIVNILSQQELRKKGRGYLVTDFLTTEDTTDSYAEQIYSQKDIYNGFTLTLLELGEHNSKIVRVTNDRHADESVSLSYPRVQDTAVYSAGNSPLRFPWVKVTKGEERFKQIVQSHRKVSLEKQLKRKLFEMMSDPHRYWPDQQLQKDDSWGEEAAERKSALFVWDPVEECGTRTTTVLLIDGQGNCSFTEKTLQTPVNTECPQWSTVSFNFKMEFPAFV